MVLGDLLSLGEFLSRAAAVDPVSAMLLVVGHVILGVSIVVFGGLTIGAIVGAIRPD